MVCKGVPAPPKKNLGPPKVLAPPRSQKILGPPKVPKLSLTVVTAGLKLAPPPPPPIRSWMLS